MKGVVAGRIADADELDKDLYSVLVDEVEGEAYTKLRGVGER